MAQQALVFWLLIGLSAGMIGSITFGGNSIWRYLAAGVAGAVLVSYAVMALGIGLPIDNWLMRQLVVATGGSVFVVLLARVMH